MTDPRAELIEKYLAGDTDADEVQQLSQALADDPLAAEVLMSEAYMDVHLRETLSGSALGAAIAEESQAIAEESEAIAKESKPPCPIAWRLLPTRWLAAAMLLAAISGWAVAAYVVGELREARRNISTLESRVTELSKISQFVEAERREPPGELRIPPDDSRRSAKQPTARIVNSDLERASTSSSATIADRDVPEIHSMRGWLVALPRKGDTGTDRQTLLVGTAAPLNQRLWTCPWGAAEFRYDSGVSISVERNTTVKFNETDDLRQLTLERGMVHVTNSSETDNRPTEIQCALATVRLIHGQVAVQVDRQRTAVEAAVNEVEVLAEEDGVVRTFTVRRGEYLIIKPGEEPKVIQGMLKLGLEPPNT